MARMRTRRWAATAAVTVLTGFTLVASLDPTARHTPASPSALADLPVRTFAPTSTWYRPLPADVPLDPQSSDKVAFLNEQGRSTYALPDGRAGLVLNTDQYSPTMYVASPDDPMEQVRFHNCFGGTELPAGLAAQGANVRIPADARPAQGTDREMAVYDPATDTVHEFWRIEKKSDGWLACWGGKIEHASTSDGVYPAPYGVAASGLSFFGGVVRYDELRRGQIDHVVGVALPHSNPPPDFSAPATRTDGANPSGRPTVSQGQLLRLPADLDLDSLGLNPIELALAKAAQKYGLRVWDSAGSVSFRAENPLGWGGTIDDYQRLYRQAQAGRGLAPDPLARFPLDKLQVVAKDYVPPARQG